MHSPSRTLVACHSKTRILASKGLGRTFVVVIASLLVSEAICNSMLVQTVATTGKQLLCGAKWRHWRGRDMTASEYATANGLDEPMPLISMLSPALDLIRSTPPDPAHSELQGVAAQTHRLLVTGILTENAKGLYSSMLQNFCFPPGFPRIRNPVTHLGSYSIAEHSRWAIMVAPLLRCWLRKRHIKPEFWEAIAAKASTSSGRSRRATPALLARTARQSRSESPGLITRLTSRKPPLSGSKTRIGQMSQGENRELIRGSTKRWTSRVKEVIFATIDVEDKVQIP